VATAPEVGESEQWVVLPEEQIVIASETAMPDALAARSQSYAHGQVRYATQELASSASATKRFVTVVAPVTFSSNSDSTAIYAGTRQDGSFTPQ
jgi:hypothetical protein